MAPPRPKVLVTRHVFPKALARLADHVTVDYNDSHDVLSEVELTQRIADVDGVVCQLTDPMTQVVLEAGSAVCVVANVAVGYDNIDIDAATRNRIVVTNTPDVLNETSADFAFALLLASARRLAEGDRFVRDGAWKRWEVDLLCGVDVHRRTLGIVGLGRIGGAVARRARGFEMRLLYHSRHPLEEAQEQALGVEYRPLDELLSEADFVSLHVPLNDDTRHLIGARELDLMKRTAVLINTARGSVVDEQALADALDEGRIGAAGLDVFEREPSVEARLLASPRVTLAPHIASSSVATREKMCTMAVDNVLAVLAGRRPPNLVNPAAIGQE